MEPLLRIDNLTLSFHTETGTTRALEQVSFSVSAGEVVALVGESGSGKSVTSLSILQLLPRHTARYEEGSVYFLANGKQPVDLLTLPEKELQKIRGHHIAMIFQEPMTSLNPVMTCGRQVMEALRMHKKLSYRQAREQTLNWFEKVKLPDPQQTFAKYPHQLSGGQKQRVMIALAMCCEPQLLICDEPTTALDVTVQKTILELLRELQQQTGMGIIFITHDLGVVAEIADRTIVMLKGKIVEENTVSEIFHHPVHPYTRGLLACRPVLHEKGKRLPVVADFLAGKGNTVLASIAKPGISSEVLLKADKLSVWYPTRRSWLGKPLAYTKAVDEVSFEIYKGEVLGLVGESGCGKTTLGRSLLRLIDPTSGHLYYKGEDISSISRDQLRPLRKDIQLVFQDPFSSLNPRLPVGPAIAEPLRVHYPALTASQRKQRVMELLEKVGLNAMHYNRYPHEFSGGQRQRIVIARALALNPSFLVCDESVSALDVSVQAQVLNLLNDLRSEFGFTVVFISHDLSVVRYISDRIMVMYKGKIEESGPAGQVYLHPQSAYTQRLIAAIPAGIPA
ncbi:MAG: ABC transporter ATP-binding protein [Chitinophagaceae bacterium]